MWPLGQAYAIRPRLQLDSSTQVAQRSDPESFATNEDLERFATKEDLREEGERSRRYMHVLHESLVDKINQILTGR
jgi:hypothetical protein